jgi:hypothetical protein
MGDWRRARKVIVELLLVPFTVACTLLVVAGAAKLRWPASTQAVLTATGARIPSPAIRLLAAAEIAIGASAAVRPSAATAALVAVLYGAFAIFALTAMRSAGQVPCGCFGAGLTRVGPVHVALNVAGCATAVAAAVASPPGIRWILGLDFLTAIALGLGTAAAVLAAYLAYTAFPAAWAAYERQR